MGRCSAAVPSAPLDPRLPINQRRDEIERAIREHQVIVLCGETGSGKTTQLPQMCLAIGRGVKGMIAHTQPRRLAARSVAARIAEEVGEPLGQTIGVKVRFHEQTSRSTRVKLLTDGMLLAELAGDRELRAYDTIIIDEAHERSLNIDFLLGILRDLLPRRPDLKLIVTSATIDTARFAAYFAGTPAAHPNPERKLGASASAPPPATPPRPAPIIEVSGRTFPVEIRYRPCTDDEDDFDRVEVGAVVDAVEELCNPRLPQGDILVFLPGEREIRVCTDALRRAMGNDAEILPLFSRLTNAEQDRIFRATSGEKQRVVLATNIAETSLTVPGIRYVVDTGLARLNRYDPQKKVQRLPIEPVSRASANQRSGRCGRVSEGVAIRLYSKDSFEARPAFTDPEVKRSGLAGVILQMRALSLGDIEAFPFLEPPDAAAIRDGYETLFELGAIDAPARHGRLTEIGRRMARIPADPRVARMLLAAQHEGRSGCVEEVIVLAAALSIQDPRERPMGKQDEADRAGLVFRHESSDFLTLLRLWDQYEHASDSMGSGAVIGWCRSLFVSAARMREWGETIRQLRTVADELELPRRRGRIADAVLDEDAIHRALLTGLISNVACREGGTTGPSAFEYRGMRGNVVSIFPGSVLFKKAPQWIMSAEVAHTTRLYARTCARIDPQWVEELAGHVFQHQLSDHHLDSATGEPCAWERVTMSGIVVVPRRKTAIAQRDPARARSLFILEALARGKWQPTGAEHTPALLAANRLILESAARAGAKLRRHDVGATPEALAMWFDARLGPEVCDPASLRAWLGADASRDRTLRLAQSDVLRPDAVAALDAVRFPDSFALASDAGDVRVALEYTFSPGHEDDGVTASIPLTALPALGVERAAWLVPGMLGEVVLALVKSLPKPLRVALESKSDLAEAAHACAELTDFGEGGLPAALSDAASGLYGVDIPPTAWPLAGLPAHLRLRVRVVDHHGAELASSRDVGELQQRFEARIRKARAAEARHRFQRDGVTDWTFGDLPERVASEDGSTPDLFPAIVDREAAVELTLVESSDHAARLNHAGIRRLFALACREEVEAHLDSLPSLGEMVKHYQALGNAAQLKGELTALIAERAFMSDASLPTTRDTFESRKQECWGRLVTTARDVGDIVSRILEPRAIVARRLNQGTNRNWALSVADIREHAAYLMPRGFLLTVPWEHLRRYPLYSAAMRARLLNLREDGSGAEKELLTKFAPAWKRFTAWVARAMSAERARAEAEQAEAEKATRAASSGGKGAAAKAPLPQSRRAAPRVNLEAGEWAMDPGALPPAVWAYRWLLEDARVELFAPETPGAPRGVFGTLDAAWKKAGA
ncbi:MAG: ATP-dependent RNA helicase HrpA [Phycisphaerales bacterium]